MQRQPDAGQLLPRPFQRARRLFGGAALDHEVIRVAGQPPDKRLLGLLRLIETVQVDVRQQRRQDAALGAPLVGVVKLTLPKIARLQPAVDEPQHLSVAEAPPQGGHQRLVVQGVEELLDVGVHHPPESLARVLVDGFQSVQGAFLRPEPEGAAFEIRLEDRFQEQLGGRLHHPIPHRRDAERTRAGGVAPFGDLHPPHRLGAIGLVLQALRDPGQKCRHPLGFDLGQRLLVDPGGPVVSAHQLPGALQDIRQRQPVIQGVEAAGGIALRGLVKLRLEDGRSVFGWVGRFDTHRTVLLSLHGPAARPSLGRGSVVPLPANGTMPGSDSLWARSQRGQGRSLAY